MLEGSQSKSTLVNSLSVCISLLDPKRSTLSSPLFQSFRSQHMYEPPIPVNPETIGAMLPKLSKFNSYFLFEDDFSLYVLFGTKSVHFCCPYHIIGVFFSLQVNC